VSDYKVEKIYDNGDVDVRFPDGSWARVKTTSTMTREDFDAEVWMYKPRPPTTAPSFLAEGQIGTASPLPEPIVGTIEVPVPLPVEASVPFPAWFINRVDAYGAPESQIEYITENGLEAWQAHVAEIKAMYPKE